MTASNGNHGLGVAAAAQARGIAAEVYVSAQVSPAKARRIAAHGAVLRHAGSGPLDAELAARHSAEASGRVFISPYNDLDVMAGQGTLAVELHRQVPHPDAVFVAVGGGGLIGGVGSYLKSVSPETEIVGCWPENSPVLYQCLRAGRVIDVAERPTLSESTTGGLEPGSVTLPVCQSVIDRGILVSEAEIRAALRLMLETEHWLVEGAAAGMANGWPSFFAGGMSRPRFWLRSCNRRVLPFLVAAAGQPHYLVRVETRFNSYGRISGVRVDAALTGTPRGVFRVPAR